MEKQYKKVINIGWKSVYKEGSLKFLVWFGCSLIGLLIMWENLLWIWKNNRRSLEILDRNQHIRRVLPIRVSTSYSKGVSIAKPCISTALNKGNIRYDSSNFNSNKCFKCQGYRYIAFDYPNCKIIVIIEGETVHEKDLLNEPGQKGEVTYSG